ncbi:MAG: glycosyltransferase family 4 protein [Kiritimatiellae bacterium]|nr:glycosyltransferase family 4 protein [Kiritimatiellia bacterium]
MRIGIVESGLPPAYVGGAEIQAWNLARCLAERGHDVTVFTRCADGQKQKEQLENVEIVRILRRSGKIGFLRYIGATIMAIRKMADQLDMLLCFRITPGGVIGAGVRKLTGLPFCTSIRGGDWYFVEPKWWGMPLLRFVLRTSNKTIVQSSKISDDVKSMFPWLAPEIVPNGIEPCDGIADGESVIFVGNLIPRKGVDVLIEAMMDIPDAALVIAGDGPEKKRLMAMAKGMNVEFVGRLEPCDVREFMVRRGRVLVLPAVAGEGFPNVILEAMSVGLPVIASDIAGIGDLLEGGEAGKIVPPSDSALLRVAIEELLNNQDAWRELSRAGKKASQKYSWDQVSSLFESVLMSISLSI